MPFSSNYQQKKTALWLLISLVLGALVLAFGSILTPFLVSIVFAYTLNPGVDWLISKRWGNIFLPRTLAALFIVLLLILVALAVVLIALPVLCKELTLLQDQIPNFLDELDGIISPRLHEFGIRARLDSNGIRRMLTEQLFTSGSDGFWTSILSSVKVGSTAVLGWIATVLLMPVMIFYLLKDWHSVVYYTHQALPPRWRSKSISMMQEVGNLIAQYLGRQSLVMLILSIYYSTGLAIIGLDVALPVGIIAGLLVFIPYFGFGFGIGLSLISAMLQFRDWHALILVSFIYGVGHLLESLVLIPRLVGKRIGLHPLVVIFSLMAFSQFFGVAGILLALPCSAIISVVFKHLRTYYFNSSFYQN